MTPLEMERVYLAYERDALNETQFSAVVSMMTNVERLRMVEFIAKRRKCDRDRKSGSADGERQSPDK